MRISAATQTTHSEFFFSANTCISYPSSRGALATYVPYSLGHEAALAPDNNSAVPEVAMQILSYFQRNPGAADSLEGIARWRLLQEQIHRTVQETQQALDWLVAQGFVAEESRVSAGVLYRLNPEKQEQIDRLLGHGTSQNDPELGEKH